MHVQLQNAMRSYECLCKFVVSVFKRRPLGCNDPTYPSWPEAGICKHPIGKQIGPATGTICMA